VSASVLGVIRVSEEAKREAIHGMLDLAHELRERLAVALGGAPSKLVEHAAEVSLATPRHSVP
jgi:hypothetical protein